MGRGARATPSIRGDVAAGQRPAGAAPPRSSRGFPSRVPGDLPTASWSPSHQPALLRREFLGFNHLSPSPARGRPAARGRRSVVAAAFCRHAPVAGAMRFLATKCRSPNLLPVKSLRRFPAGWRSFVATEFARLDAPQQPPAELGTLRPHGGRRRPTCRRGRSVAVSAPRRACPLRAALEIGPTPNLSKCAASFCRGVCRFSVAGGGGKSRAEVRRRRATRVATIALFSGCLGGGVPGEFEGAVEPAQSSYSGLLAPHDRRPRHNRAVEAFDARPKR